MPHQIVQQYQKKLHQFYAQINPQKANHITKQQLHQWLSLCLNDQDIAQNPNVQQLAQQADESFEFWFEAYLKEVCNLEPQNIEKLELKQEEVIQFFSWLLDTQTNQQQQQGQQQNNQAQQSQQQNIVQQQESNHHQEHPNNPSKVTENKSFLKNNTSQLSSKNNSNVNHSQQQQHTSNLFRQQQPNEFTQALTNSQPVDKNTHPKSSQNLQSFTQLPQQHQRYKQYLQTIFQHYCKISFGLTKDNTFESMQKNVSIITMNKFMIFSNDFELNILLPASLPKINNQKPNKIFVRNLLMDVFKKNSTFHKQMNFQQFLNALERIAETCFSKMKPVEKTQKSQKQISQSKNTQKPQEPLQPQQISRTKYSFQMVKMIKYLQISSFKQFRQKMTKFNINFSLKFNKQLQDKKPPINYKFKFESQQNLNAKKLSQHNQPQNKPPATLPSQKRNIVLRQGEHNINRPKYSMEMAKTPLQSKMSTPNMISIPNHNLIPKDKKPNTKNISSHQRLGNVSNNRQDRNIIDYNNQSLQKGSKHNLEKLKTPVPIYEGVLQGYANIHLAKKGLLPIDSIKIGQSGVRKKGDYQLNNVIEEARKQTQDPLVYYDYLDSRSGRAMSNISASKPLTHYSRNPASNQSNRQSRNDQQLQLNPTQAYQKLLNSRAQNPTKNNSRVNSVHNQLEGLIDFNDSDEDEYLDQHLKKEKENDTEITVRVQKKISSLNFKL